MPVDQTFQPSVENEEHKCMIGMTRIVLLSLVVTLQFLIRPEAAVAQYSAYKLDGLKDGLIAGSSISLLTYSRIMSKKVKPLTQNQLDLLDREDVFRLDRRATYNRSKTAAKISDYLLNSSYLLPLTMLAGASSREDFDKTLIFSAEALLVNTAITDFAKVTAKRNRPFTYNDSWPAEIKRSRGARLSYFSGHTSTTATMYFLTAKLFADYYSDSKWKPMVWTASVLVPATVGFLRVRAGKHFITDVVTGFVVGAAAGILIPHIHRVTK